MKWISVKDELPKHGKKVIATYRNSHNKSRQIMAERFDKFKEESNGEEDQYDEYDEKTDAYYIVSGWYECIENWDDFTSVRVNEGEITRWMPLPEPPTCKTCGYRNKLNLNCTLNQLSKKVDDNDSCESWESRK